MNCSRYSVSFDNQKKASYLFLKH